MKDPAPTTSRKSKKVEIDMAPAWQKYANAILIPVIIGLAVYLFVRWKMDANNAERLGYQFKLTSARARINELRAIDFGSMSQDEVHRFRGTKYEEADKSLNDLGSAKDPIMKAETLIARGDLNWTIANFPELPGATSRPSLHGPKPREELLRAAESAYNQVLSSYANQPLAVNSARLGLAAVAQNRRNFDEAEKQLKAVEDDAAAPEAFKSQAKIQRELNKTIRMPVYLPTTNPSTQPTVAIEPTTRPATQPAK